MRRTKTWLWAACLSTQALAQAPELAKPQDIPEQRVDAPWFHCHQGRYALGLPQHYPTLHRIGRHRFSDLIVTGAPGSELTTRRIDYMGLRLEVKVSASDSQRYVLLQLQSNSRRWKLGELSVGESPWRWPWRGEAELANVRLQGRVVLAGPTDTATLQMSNGRIDSLSVVCAAPA